MSRRSRVLLALTGLIGAALLVFSPNLRLPRAYANVTLVDFKAAVVPGQSAVLVQWETATEFNTVGFFVTRSDSASGSYNRVSDFKPNEGDQLTGAQYDWLDSSTVANHTYWYKLEEITADQQSQLYGPISVTTTLSHTATATSTPTPTSTATAKAKATKAPTVSIVTPQLATGSTVTPRPTGAEVVTHNPAPTAAPSVFAPASEPVSSPVPQPVSSIATPAPVVSSGSTAHQNTSAPTPMTTVQTSDPSLTSASLLPLQIAPAVVVTEAGPSSNSQGTENGTIPLLLIAVILLLGGGLAVFFQARK